MRDALDLLPGQRVGETLAPVVVGIADIAVAGFDSAPAEVTRHTPRNQIEDATKAWETTDSVPVARIRIPAPQTGLDTPEHIQECEELVFTPWHSLAEHQPLGSINRLRYAIYKASAETRLQSAQH